MPQVVYDRVRTLLSSSNSMNFQDFLHDLFKFSKTMGSAVSFKNSTTFPCFRVSFDLKQFNRHKLVSTEMRAIYAV